MEKLKAYFKDMPWYEVLFTVLAIGFCAFHLITSGGRALPGLQQRLVHLTFGLGMIFLIKPVTASRKGKGPTPVDLVLAALSIAVGCYLTFNFELIQARLGVSPEMDIVAGFLLVLLVIEATRRTMGLPLPILGGIALAYAFFGNLLPRGISHGGYGVRRIVSHLALTTEGIFSAPIASSATVVVIFIIFACFLNGIGAGKYFVDVAMSKLGRVRGGTAKATVIGSGLMGMLTGSVTATIMGIGTFTVPMMKEDKYDGKITAAITAVASTGGQIMPPVMGAAAYIIADMLKTPFTDIAKAAIIPAVLFYVAAYVYMDLEARKNKRIGLTKEETEAYKKSAKGKFYLVLPILLIVVLMVFFKTLPVRAAFYSIVLTFVIGVIQKDGRITPVKLLDIFRSAARGTLDVIVATACAGIIVGVLSLTGLGLQLSSLIIGLAGGSLVVLLILTMFISIIMGMGMTTTACYVILAVLVAPALVGMGIQPLAAHFFVFFFGMYSFLTPPVALGAYSAASLTGSDPFQTGWLAFKIAIPGFIIPYLFVFSPAMLFIGTPFEIIYVTITACIGMSFMAASLVGFLRRDLPVWMRVPLFAAGLLLAYPGTLTDIIGVALGAAVIAMTFAGKEKGTPLSA